MIKQPRIEPHPTKIGYYVVLKDFTYKWNAENFDRKLVIPKGFVFDLASVPRIFWTPTGIAPDRLRWTAPLCHDFPYRYGGKLPAGSYFKRVNGKWVEDTTEWTRKNADRLFCRIMREDGIPRRKRRVAYRTVDIFGRFFWGT